MKTSSKKTSQTISKKMSSNTKEAVTVSPEATSILAAAAATAPTSEAIEEILSEEMKKEKKKARASISKSSFKALKNNESFYVHKGFYEVLKRNIEKAKPTLLLGPTGVGKTELIANIANELKLPVTIFDMGTMTDPVSSLIGTHVMKVKDGTSFSNFVPSRFSQLIQKPGIIVLDEINRANVQSNNILFSCFDFRRELNMEYSFENYEPIKVHPECVFVATANIGSQYTGTHKLDKALQSRFMIIKIDELPAESMEEMLSSRFKNLGREEISAIVRYFKNFQNAHANYEISYSLSTRDVISICELVDDNYTIYDAFFIVCHGLCDPEIPDAISQDLTKYLKNE